MDDIINPAGWTAFDSIRPEILNTTFYAEYNSTGAGGAGGARIKQDHILTAEEAENFTIDKVFLSQPGWVDFEYLFWIELGVQLYIHNNGLRNV